MIEQLFVILSDALSSRIELALIAAFGWGVLSILLSPCHLSGIPLIIGFISTQEHVTIKRSFVLSSIFGFGVLATIGLIGLVTASLGRLIGDVGFTGNLVVSATFMLVGLYLLDVIRVSWEGIPLHTHRKGGVAAFLLGLLFGVGLGPCTFAYMAPVLGVVFQVSLTSMFLACALLLMFGIGHTGVIVAAGTSTQWVQVYLNWTDGSKSVARLRRVCGVLVVAGGAYLMVQTLWP